MSRSSGDPAFSRSGEAAGPLAADRRETPSRAVLAAHPAAVWALAGLAASLAVMTLWLGGAAASDADRHAATPYLLVHAALLLGLAGHAFFAARRAGTVPQEASRRDDVVPLSAISDLVTWHDGFGDVVRASAGSSALIGVAPRSLVGGGFLARVHVSDRPTFLKALSDASNGVEPVAVEFRLHGDPRSLSDDEAGPWQPGAVVHVEMRVHRLQAGASSRATVMAFTRDLTAERRRADELERARLEAERANDLKGRFLATVSHELRTPLNAIIGFSELLSADHPFLITEDRRREYAHIIRSSGIHLLELVNTLLDMSKIETGNFHFEPEPFDFCDLTANACDLIQIKADAAKVRVERSLARGLPEIVADRRACRQILLNLVSNAVKFTPAGGLVTVSVVANADTLVLSVADTGIGIPEADLPKIGDAFFQAGDVHRRHHEGTGLGLSVVRGLVGIHGGRLSIESGTGVGTTVTVSLPLAGPGEAVIPKPAQVHILPRVSAQIPERKSA